MNIATVPKGAADVSSTARPRLDLMRKGYCRGRHKKHYAREHLQRLVVEQFPSLPQKFVLYTVLTAGLGDGTIHLVVRHLDTNEEIFTAEMPVRFPDRVAEARVLFRINRCSFPAEGEYLCTLLLGDEWLAQRRMRVIRKET
jgi:hypothetical protein